MMRTEKPCLRAFGPPALLAPVLARRLVCCQFFIEGIIPMSAKLFVDNLSPEATASDLRSLLREAGVCESCSLIIYRFINRSTGFAFIEMPSSAAADATRERLNGKGLHGLALQISHVSPKRMSANLTDYHVSRHR